MTPPLPPAGLAALYPEAAFLSPVGSGAYGQVWLARFPGGRHLAVKYVPAPAPGSGTPGTDRERRALHLLHALADPAAPDIPLHPALLPVLDFRESPDGFACTMPLADSLRPNWRADPAHYRPRTLATELLARRALPLPECLALAEALASALDFLQRHCLVHRDIKPANVLYLGGAPVLADFGLLADTREAASVVGTPGYVPGEQHGRFPADIYSLGVLLSEALTGRPAAETGFAPVDEADTAHPLYARFLALLRRATDPNPARRPQTAAAFLKDLRALAAPARKSARRPVLVPFLLLLILAIPAYFLLRPSARHPALLPPGLPSDLPPPAPAPVTADVPADVSAALPSTAPPAPEPSTNRPLLYISRNMADSGAFLQLYTDRIRVGLPLRGVTAEDACLLLVLPPDDPAYDPDAVWTGPAPWRLLPLLPATPDTTPPTVARDPVFPSDAPYPARTTHSAIAILPDDTPYPEAIFLLPNPPYVWESRLAALPDATFGDLEHLWWKTCELPRFEREADAILREAEQNDILSGRIF